MDEYEYQSRLSRPIENLTNKGFDFSSFATFKLATNLTQKFSFKSQILIGLNKSSSALSKLSLTSNQFLMLQKFDSDKGSSTSIKYNLSSYPEFRFRSKMSFKASGLSIGLSVKHISPSAEFCVYLTENNELACKLTKNLQKNSKIDLFACVSPSPFTLKSFRSAYSWTNKDFSLVFQDFLSNSPYLGLGRFKFLGLFNWSEQTSLSWIFGGFNKKNILNEVKLGIQLNLTPNTLVKLRFDQDANCSLWVKTQLTPWISLSTSTQQNLFDPSLQKLSFYFNLAPKS